MTSEGRALEPDQNDDERRPSEFDTHGWLPKADAAQLLKVQPRQLEKRAEQGLIEKKVLPRRPNEKTARVVYSRADIQAILAGEPKASDRTSPHRDQAQPEESALQSTRVQEIVALVSALRGPAPYPTVKPFMTLEEAAEYAELPIGLLRKLIRTGRLPAEHYTFNTFKRDGDKLKRRSVTTTYVKSADLRGMEFATRKEDTDG
jgi:hypothetical protein